MHPNPVFGRTQELGRAVQVLERTRRVGQGGVILIEGEPGIGKTALLEAIAQRASTLQFVVGSGKAEQFESIAPMAPLYLALRSGPIPLLTHQEFAELAPLHDQQLWLVDRLTEMLEERALKSPLLVVVDDVQWVDRLSAFSLRIMPGRLAGSAVVWLFAARTHSGTPVEDIIPPSSSDVTVERIRLAPLPPAAIDELAFHHRGAPAKGRLRQLLRMASGYPFLAVALLEGYPVDNLPVAAEAATPLQLNETASRAEESLPQKLIDSVLRRLRMLPADALRLVQVASVLGRSSGVEDVTALMGVTPLSSLLPSLEAAVHAGILRDEGDRIEFRHDLFRQAVYEDMPRSIRRGLHQAAAKRFLAEGRGALDAAPHVLEYAKDGDADAVRILRHAASAVAEILPTVGVELIQHAFALLTSEDPMWLQTGTEAVAILARARRGRDAAVVADQLLATSILVDSAASLQVLVARALGETGYVRDMRARVDAALALDGVSERLRAELLALRALAFASEEEPADAALAGKLALEQAQRVYSLRATTDALQALGQASRNDGRNAEALEYFTQARQLEPATSPAEEIITLGVMDRYDASHDLLAAVRADNDDRRIRFAPAIAYAKMWHDYGLGLLDEMEAEARALLQLCDDLQEDVYRHEALIVLCRGAQLRGDLAAARAHLAAAASHRGRDDETWSMRLSMMEGWLAESDNDFVTAVNVSRRFLHPPRGGQHRWRWAAQWLMGAARIAVRGNDREFARDVAAMTNVLAERNPKVATVTGIAVYVDGLVRRDPTTLRRAVGMLRASPRPIVRAEASAGLGATELEVGQKDAGVAALDDAWDVFHGLGAHGEARRIQGLLQNAGVRRRQWSMAHPRPVEGWGALTEAELRVAQLVADGHTNRSAAIELTLSPHTVTTHLRSIFGKLSVSSRSQLTRAVMVQR